jgi:hypothetical protein
MQVLLLKFELYIYIKRRKKKNDAYLIVLLNLDRMKSKKVYKCERKSLVKKKIHTSSSDASTMRHDKTYSLLIRMFTRDVIVRIH